MEHLAKMSGMGVSTLHHHFLALTAIVSIVGED